MRNLRYARPADDPKRVRSARPGVADPQRKDPRRHGRSTTFTIAIGDRDLNAAYWEYQRNIPDQGL
jgi:hypothetical protein